MSIAYFYKNKIHSFRPGVASTILKRQLSLISDFSRQKTDLPAGTDWWILRAKQKWRKTVTCRKWIKPLSCICLIKKIVLIIPCLRSKDSNTTGT